MLWVLLYHSWFLESDTMLRRVLYTIPNLGLVGVEYFFVMSGFLITCILLRYRSSPWCLRGFYGRRILRTLPLYFGFLLVIFHLIPMFPEIKAVLYQFDDPLAFRQGQLWHWLFLSNIWYASRDAFGVWYLSPTWSLAIEEQFYLVWPVTLLALGRVGGARACVAALVVSVMVRTAMVLAGETPLAVYVFTFGRLDGIAVGCLLGCLAMGPRGLDWMQRARRWMGWPGAALFLFAVLWTIVMQPIDDHPWKLGTRFLINPVFLTVGMLGVALWSGGIVAYMTVGEEAGLSRRWMRNPVLCFFAKHSYAMYLVHTPAYHVVALLFQRFVFPWRERALGWPVPSPDTYGWLVFNQVEILAATLALSTAISVASHHLLEKHFLKLKDSFPYAQEGDRGGEKPPRLGEPAT